MSSYHPDSERYAKTPYIRCGRFGLKLPRIALGLWHNFGGVDAIENQRAMLRRAFDLGINHFDLANNYGPPYGSAEANLGKLLREDFSSLRDELIISTKAGWDMWPGPYGNGSSRKYLLASLDQSLNRLGLDHVDVFYSHRFDPDCPLDETMGALASAVQSGKALYAGISSYSADQTREAAAILKDMGVPLLIHQPKYSMFDREPEPDLLPTLGELGVGCIAFSPLAQGLLTNRYLDGIPDDSRAGKSTGYLRPAGVTEQVITKVRALHEIASERDATLAQLAVLWLLRRPELTSVLIGASRVSQIEDIHRGLGQPVLGSDELEKIETILTA